MLNDERESIFSGALTIIMFQIIYLYILTIYFFEEDGFKNLMGT